MEMAEDRNIAIIILAAGKGTRMKSDKAKVLHEILGRPMISYVTATAREVAGDNVILVVGHQAERVRSVVAAETADIVCALQEEQLGTGHAVQCAMPHLPQSIQEVIILCGDVPLLSATTIRALQDDHRTASRDISLLAVEVDDPTGYGRILMDRDRNLIGIVEEADADPAQKKIKLINSGIYCVNRDYLDASLARIKPDNAQGEFYLTDIVSIGYQEGKRVGVLVGEDADEITGVNTIDDLQSAKDILRDKQS
jgi:UDP-N-acetylglucosamine diphosphorylase/glucosamine-1-phosphate N-acetyltransferase